MTFSPTWHFKFLALFLFLFFLEKSVVTDKLRSCLKGKLLMILFTSMSRYNAHTDTSFTVPEVNSKDKND